MLFRSTIPDENFPKEKEIVLEEMARDASDPRYQAAERFRAFAYAATPLARPVLGTFESIRGIPRNSVLRYYRSRYTPANMVLVVMGDFETGAMLESVRRTFGRAPKGPPAPRETGARWPAAPKENLSVFQLDTPSRMVTSPSRSGSTRTILSSRRWSCCSPPSRKERMRRSGAS